MLLQIIQFQTPSISISTFCWTIGIFITIIIGLIAFIGKFIMKFNDAMNTKFDLSINEIRLNLKEEVQGTEEEMKEIKENYLSRFDKIYKLIHDGNKGLLDTLTELRVEVAHLKNK